MDSLHFIRLFFDKAPALFLGLIFFLGVAFGIHHNMILLIPFTILLILNHKIFWQGLLLGIVGWVYASNSYCFVPFEANGVLGKAKVKIEQLTLIRSSFSDYWYYKGKLESFLPDLPLKETPKNISVTFKIKDNRNFIRPLANCTYVIPCRLISYEGNRYAMQLNFERPWQKDENTFSFAETRYRAKEKIREIFYNYFPNKNAREFLSGLVTGEFNENKVKKAFSRFSLLHLMAISGFHFSLIAGIFILLFRPICSPQKVMAFTTVLLLLYFAFLGNSPSVLRACMMTILSFGSLFAKRPTNSRNALGIALIVSIIYDPSLCCHLGFQFSFLITAAILLCCRPTEWLLLRIFPKKEISSLKNYSFLEKHFLIIFGFLRPIMVLNIVTTIASLPLCLYYFKKFPLLGLVYNTYFPLLVSFSIFLLIAGCIFTPIPLISNSLHLINDKYTQFILNMTLDVPKKLDLCIEINNISINFLIVFYLSFFLFSIYFYTKYTKEELASQKLII